MNKLLLICLEAKNPKTEKDFFKSIVDNNKELIAIQYLDQEKIDSDSLKDINVNKLTKMTHDKNINCEIICFCDGDINEKQLESINNTYKIIINFFKSKGMNVISNELLYDKGFSFEFFIWHITEKYDPVFFNDNKNNINMIRTKYKKDLVDIYGKYDEKIKDINGVKNNSRIIWKPIIDYHKKDNDKNHVQISKNILKKFNNDNQNSIHFKILTKIIERHEFLTNKYFSLDSDENENIDN